MDFVSLLDPRIGYDEGRWKKSNISPLELNAAEGVIPFYGSRIEICLGAAKKGTKCHYNDCTLDQLDFIVGENRSELCWGKDPNLQYCNINWHNDTCNGERYNHVNVFFIL